MPDNPYPPRMSDGEIRALFDAMALRVDALRTEVRSGNDTITSELAEVKVQTTRTNGRVDKLESYRDRLMGALLVLLFVQPVLTALVVDWIQGR